MRKQQGRQPPTGLLAADREKTLIHPTMEQHGI